MNSRPSPENLTRETPEFSPDLLLQPIALPCGVRLANRLVKAAMTERLSGRDYAPNALHEALYRRWADGGTGLLITGNMLVNAKYMESAGNIAPLVGDQRAALTRMAEAAKSGGGQVWVQLNHAGRQTSRLNNFRPVSASDVGLKKLGFFSQPRPMREDEIQALIRDFVRCAALLRDCGFDGIQVHAAHGYLLSQFLSPLTNHRTDAWGGSLANRARLLLDVVRAVRGACGPAFPISVKINSADFQRGGFDEDDSLTVIGWLEQEGLDLLEISGGNYEKLVFFTQERDSTRARESYFGAFARQVKQATKLPVLLTGGFRTRGGCHAALADGDADLVGLARPFLCQPDFGRRFLSEIPGEWPLVHVPTLSQGSRKLDDLAEAGFWDAQVDRIARGLAPDLAMGGWASISHLLQREVGKAMTKQLAGAA